MAMAQVFIPDFPTTSSMTYEEDLPCYPKTPPPSPPRAPPPSPELQPRNLSNIFEISPSKFTTPRKFELPPSPTHFTSPRKYDLSPSPTNSLDFSTVFTTRRSPVVSEPDDSPPPSVAPVPPSSLEIQNLLTKVSNSSPVGTISYVSIPSYSHSPGSPCSYSHSPGSPLSYSHSPMLPHPSSHVHHSSPQHVGARLPNGFSETATIPEHTTIDPLESVNLRSQSYEQHPRLSRSLDTAQVLDSPARSQIADSGYYEEDSSQRRRKISLKRKNDDLGYDDFPFNYSYSSSSGDSDWVLVDSSTYPQGKKACQDPAISRQRTASFGTAMLQAHRHHQTEFSDPQAQRHRTSSFGSVAVTQGNVSSMLPTHSHADRPSDLQCPQVTRHRTSSFGRAVMSQASIGNTPQHQSSLQASPDLRPRTSSFGGVVGNHVSSVSSTLNTHPCVPAEVATFHPPPAITYIPTDHTPLGRHGPLSSLNSIDSMDCGDCSQWLDSLDSMDTAPSDQPSTIEMDSLTNSMLGANLGSNGASSTHSNIHPQPHLPQIVAPSAQMPPNRSHSSGSNYNFNADPESLRHSFMQQFFSSYHEQHNLTFPGLDTSNPSRFNFSKSL